MIQLQRSWPLGTTTTSTCMFSIAQIWSRHKCRGQYIKFRQFWPFNTIQVNKLLSSSTCNNYQGNSLFLRANPRRQSALGERPIQILTFYKQAHIKLSKQVSLAKDQPLALANILRKGLASSKVLKPRPRTQTPSRLQTYSKYPRQRISHWP